MKVLGNKVLVRQDPAEDRVGSLYVPQGKENFPTMATVVYVGVGVKENIKVGDRVIFKRKPESCIDMDAKKDDPNFGLLVLPEENILAVIDGD